MCYYIKLSPLGYFQTFKPVIQAVMEFYQPTCIVLQVIIVFPFLFLFMPKYVTHEKRFLGAIND